MKKLFLLLAVVSLLTTACDDNQDKPADNVIWYTTTDGEPILLPEADDTIFGAGLISNYYFDGKGILTFDGNVTFVGDYAFAECSNLKSITIPDRVTKIGEKAFRECSNLASVTLGKRVSDISGAFYGCSSLTSVTIPDKVTSIRSETFKYCSSLTNITIPDKVTSIGKEAFYGCSNLTSVTIPDKVTLIGSSAFKSCNSLTSVQISDLSAWCKIDFEGVYANPLCNGANLYLNGNLITELAIPSDITAIKDCTFSGCSSLKSVTIPDGITRIGKEGFYGCSSLTSVHISDLSAWCKIDFETASANPLCNGANLYLNGNLITELAIPSDITAIKNYTFYNCKSLTSVNIPDGITWIGQETFSYCCSLASITIPNSITWIGKPVEDSDLVVLISRIPDPVNYGNKTFYGCNSLTSVHISDLSAWCGIRFEGVSANPLCNGANLYLNGNLITELVIPSDITAITDCAFSGCSSLTNVTIPYNITTIGCLAFYGCNNLTNVQIPDLSAWCKIDFEGVYANPLCNGAKLYLDGNLVTKLTIPSDITVIKDYAFSGYSSLISVNIPDKVTLIGNEAFCDCISLTNVTIPDTVAWIGKKAFYECHSLKSVHTSNLFAWCRIDFGNASANPLCNGANLYLNGNLIAELAIPSDITTIKDYTFSGCSSLKSVTIPDGITRIGKEAFYGCRSLTSVYCKPTKLPVASIDYDYWGAFDSNASNLRIYVPLYLERVYKQVQGWSDYASYIVGYDF